MPYRNWSGIEWLEASSIIAALTGVISYWYNHLNGSPFRWGEFVVSVLASWLAGLVTFLICESFSVPYELTGALAGMMGWCGTKVWKIVEIIVQKIPDWLDLVVNKKVKKNDDETI